MYISSILMISVLQISSHLTSNYYIFYRVIHVCTILYAYHVDVNSLSMKKKLMTYIATRNKYIICNKFKF